MRDISRIESCCAKLAEIWRQYPDLRLTQLMLLGTSEFMREKGYDAFYAEDQEFLDFFFDYVQRS